MLRLFLLLSLALTAGQGFAQVHDVGVVSIDCPPESVFVDSVYYPIISVANFGEDSAGIFETWFIFYECRGGYWLPICWEYESVPGLPAGDTCQVHMTTPLFFNSGADSFRMFALIVLEGDSNSVNDSLSKYFFVYGTGVYELVDSFSTLNPYYLAQNHPNPFSQHTDIECQTPVSERVLLRIYNAAGRLVKTLVDEPRQAGQYSVRWDRTDEAGRMVASGIYFYRLRAGDFADLKRMVVIR